MLLQAAVFHTLDFDLSGSLDVREFTNRLMIPDREGPSHPPLPSPASSQFQRASKERGAQSWVFASPLVQSAHGGRF